MWSIEVVSVVASSTVALTSVVIPTWTRRADRRHERRVQAEQSYHVWRAEQRAIVSEVYLDLLKGSIYIHQHVRSRAEGAPAPAELEGISGHLRARVDAYGSEPVRKAFWEWFGIANALPARMGREEATARLATLEAAYEPLAALIRAELRVTPVPPQYLEPPRVDSPFDRWWWQFQQKVPPFRWFYRPVYWQRGRPMDDE